MTKLEADTNVGTLVHGGVIVVVSGYIVPPS